MSVEMPRATVPAQELDVSRNTVRRYLKSSEARMGKGVDRLSIRGGW